MGAAVRHLVTNCALTPHRCLDAQGIEDVRRLMYEEFLHYHPPGQ